MKIVILIASHISSKKRCDHFVRLLESINNQTNYSNKMDVQISLSLDPNISPKELTNLLNIIEQNQFKVYLQDHQLSQFEHYKFLVNQLEDLDTWILFSDDDDKWASDRILTYELIINNLTTEQNNKITSICCVPESENSINNYVSYCVKLPYCKIFFDHATDVQIKHKFCDCYFVKFIRTYGSGNLGHLVCKLKREIYIWMDHNQTDPEYPTHCRLNENDITNFEEAVVNMFDYFMAGQSKSNTMIDWMSFCGAYYKNGTIGMRRNVIQYHLDNYENHIFHDKHILE